MPTDTALLALALEAASVQVERELAYRTLEDRASEEIKERRRVRTFVSGWRSQTSVDSMGAGQ